MKPIHTKPPNKEIYLGLYCVGYALGLRGRMTIPSQKDFPYVALNDTGMGGNYSIRPDFKLVTCEEFLSRLKQFRK